MSSLCLILIIQRTYSTPNAESDQLLRTKRHSFTDSFASPRAFGVLDDHPITRIDEEEELYNVIGYTCNTLLDAVTARKSPHHHFGSVMFHQDGEDFYIMNITMEMEQNPFSIAQFIVNALHHWYSTHYFEAVAVSYDSHSMEFDRRYRDIMHLVSYLRTFQEFHDIHSFEILSQLLDSLDKHFRTFTGSTVGMFQRWLFHDEYVAFISDRKLRIVDILGEGSQAFVFKVQSQINHEIYALKILKWIYRISRVRNECQSEQSIMERINIINKDIEESSSPNKERVAVPELITWTADNITINCDQHKAFLMQFIEKKTKTSISSKGYVRSVIVVKEMYSQLVVTLDLLARNGISHNDIKKENIIENVEGKHYLVDFGRALDLNRGPKDSNPLLGPFYYYSPGKLRMNELLMKDQLFNMSIPERYLLILESNIYSLRALVLHKVCRVMGRYQRYLDKMLAIHDRMNQIWKRRRIEAWDVIKEGLIEIWGIRSLVASIYISQFPQGHFVDIFKPLLMGYDNTSFHLNIVEELIGSPEPPHPKSWCCAGCVLI